MRGRRLAGAAGHPPRPGRLARGRAGGTVPPVAAVPPAADPGGRPRPRPPGGPIPRAAPHHYPRRSPEPVGPMSLLNMASDGMPNVLLALYRYLLAEGPTPEAKLIAACAPAVV